jgi:ATP-dependent DNA helicase Q4
MKKTGRKEELIRRLLRAAHSLLHCASPGTAGQSERGGRGGLEDRSAGHPWDSDSDSQEDRSDEGSSSDDDGGVSLSDVSGCSVADFIGNDLSSAPALLDVDHNPAPPDTLAVLRETFGYRDFRPGQEWAIRRALDGQSSLLVLPTGSGKTLTFLLPSVLAAQNHGITIVVSPLIALMKDQMRKLPAQLPAACMSGSASSAEVAEVTNACLKGFIRLLFVSPERLCTAAFHRFVQAIQQSQRPPGGGLTAPGVGLLCFDEAHCLSQWSFNFRPSYLRMRSEIHRIRPRAVLALTATAPLNVRRDILLHLDIPAQGVKVLPPHRPNLHLCRYKARDSLEKRNLVLERLVGKDSSELKKKRVGPAIVYVGRRDEAESLSDFLAGNGVASRPYHAGMSADQRDKVQLQFSKGTTQVIGEFSCPSAIASS